MRKVRAFGGVVALLLSSLPGCDGAPKGGPAPPPSAAERPAVAAPPLAPLAEPAESAEAGATESAEPGIAGVVASRPEPPPHMPFGVPECDNFVRKFVACVDARVPEDRRRALMDDLNQNRARWRDMARLKEAGVAQSLACRAYAQRVKGDLAVDYGCEF